MMRKKTREDISVPNRIRDGRSCSKVTLEKSSLCATSYWDENSVDIVDGR